MISLPRRRPFVLVLLALLALASPLAAARQGDDAAGGEAAAQADEEVAPFDELNRVTPRGTTEGFLQAARERDFERAARYLDLAGHDAGEGPELARRLSTVLDRTLWVGVDDMSASPEGDPADAERPDVERLVGTALGDEEPPDFLLQRERAADGTSVWLFSSGTVALASRTYAKLGFPVEVEQLLPQVLVDEEFLEVRLWQWIALILLVVAAYVAAWIAAGVAMRLIRPLVSRSRSDLDDRLLELTLPPLRLLATVALFQLALPFLGLKVPALRFFDGVCTIAIVVGVTWLVFRVVDLSASLLKGAMERRGQASATYLVPLGARTLKIVVGVLTLLAALDNLGFDVTTIIAGLGVGGLAVALALRPTLENVFGGVTVLVDQPVKPGEFCRYGDKLGTVEDVGIRSTRIRSLDRTVVTVSNAEFSSMQIENFARRDRIRLTTTIGLRYETSPDQLRYVLTELRRILFSHPRVYAEPRRVRFVGFGSSSLDVELWCYLDTKDFAEYLAIREDIYLRVMDVVDAAGTGFAFPSTTVYRADDDGLDDKRASAAEAQVAAWREAGDLMFPEFSAEELAAMKDTLDYPPKGSVAGSGT